MLKTHLGEVSWLVGAPLVQLTDFLSRQMCPQDPARPQISTKPPKTTDKVCTLHRSQPLCSSVLESENIPKSAQNASLSQPSTPRSPAGRGPRTPRRVGAQATRLEAVDDSLGPLGPLGENASAPEPEQPPIPPSKEQQLPHRNARAQHAPSPMSGSMTTFADLGDTDGSASSARGFPQGQPSPGGPEGARRQTQPSVSIEQAARPSFDITVGDPHKVGDLTSSHIVYQVRTKVGLTFESLKPLL